MVLEYWRCWQPACSHLVSLRVTLRLAHGLPFRCLGFVTMSSAHGDTVLARRAAILSLRNG